MTDDYLCRFLLDDLDIAGAIVRLGPAWREMIAERGYPAPVSRVFGEMTATTLLLAGNLKQPGRLTIQLRGDGAVSLLVIDCNEQLQIRGMARCATVVAEGPAAALLGDGQLQLALDLPSMREPYQSIVPLVGDSIAEIFEHYLMQSDQLPARLFLAASPDGAAGLFLQKLPTAEQRDADGWTRVETLAATVKANELLSLPAEELLRRLFGEETVRLFAARTVVHNCPEDWQKVRSMLRALGREEVYATLHEQGEVLIKDDICNRQYRFDAPAIDELFADPPTAVPPTLH
ncbi:MAG: Hsp33 family molecular chaperone HslO [Candidatus Accumulibacter sp.]|uniref:Hsp33 family molecular chaperone HslO n=1 Tax=Accumulibacter sp. TaxID=2053492 RepID=UPI0025FA3984|nr:Hsp33 family molecular chaperone HslO [Accumulibacter sp.]MCP5246939.1 Hsp33 family molecular chaperone HslO [Accumulibacter sp.]